MKTKNIKFYLKIKLIFIFLVCITCDDEKNNKGSYCALTHKPSEDPFPSLSKCYKYNNEACCTSVHDDIIDTYIKSLLTEPCLRKYTDFENLMCFGCHPLQEKYIDKDSNIIRICLDFALKLWGKASKEQLNSTTEIFDNCGFKTELEEVKNLTEENFVIPSEKFKSFYEFFNVIKIPFFEKYKIIIQDNVDDNCYNRSNFLKIEKILLIYYSIMLFFLF